MQTRLKTHRLLQKFYFLLFNYASDAFLFVSFFLCAWFFKIILVLYSVCIYVRISSDCPLPPRSISGSRKMKLWKVLGHLPTTKASQAGWGHPPSLYAVHTIRGTYTPIMHKSPLPNNFHSFHFLSFFFSFFNTLSWTKSNHENGLWRILKITVQSSNGQLRILFAQLIFFFPNKKKNSWKFHE